MRIALVGAGSLGTIVGALISKAGLDIVLVDANREHVEALNSQGAQVVGHMELRVPVKASLPEDVRGEYDLVIYLAKATYDEVALPQVSEHMGEESILITLQNGVPEEKVASFIGKERVLGGAVGWGATWLRPGVSELTSEPEKMEYDIGEMDGKVTDRIKRVKEVLDHAGNAVITENLVGTRWTKLLANVSMSGLGTALGCTYGDILDNQRAVDAAICIILESLITAKALGIKMEPMQGVDPNVLMDIARESWENARNAVNLVWNPHRDQIPSMLQDLRKGLPCEVEALNGYLSAMSAKAGVSTPVNDQVTEIIRAIQAKKMGLDFSNLDKIKIPDPQTYFE